jgi:hypothetical protein
MTLVIFAGLPVSVYDLESFGYDIKINSNRLLSGYVHTQLSPVAHPFPKTFQCYTKDFQEITDLAAKIGTFQNLYIDNVLYEKIYISKLDNIKEVILYSGKYLYRIEFSQTDFY